MWAQLMFLEPWMRMWEDWTRDALKSRTKPVDFKGLNYRKSEEPVQPYRGIYDEISRTWGNKE